MFAQARVRWPVRVPVFFFQSWPDRGRVPARVRVGAGRGLSSGDSEGARASARLGASFQFTSASVASPPQRGHNRTHHRQLAAESESESA